MARPITLAQLRDQIREYTDAVHDPHISNSFLNSCINRAVPKFVDLVIHSFGTDYYVSNTTLTTDGTLSLDLPSDFYKLSGIDVQTSSVSFRELYRFNFHRRNQSNTWEIILPEGINLQYRIVGNELVFAPIPPTGKTLRIWYVPTSILLEDDGDVFDFINGWEEYVILFCAIRVKLKKEESIVSLKTLLDEQRDEILLAAENRDSAQEEVVHDVYDDGFYMRGYNG